MAVARLRKVYQATKIQFFTLESSKQNFFLRRLTLVILSCILKVQKHTILLGNRRQKAVVEVVDKSMTQAGNPELHR